MTKYSRRARCSTINTRKSTYLVLNRPVMSYGLKELREQEVYQVCRDKIERAETLIAASVLIVCIF